MKIWREDNRVIIEAEEADLKKAILAVIGDEIAEAAEDFREQWEIIDDKG